MGDPDLRTRLFSFQQNYRIYGIHENGSSIFGGGKCLVKLKSQLFDHQIDNQNWIDEKKELLSRKFLWSCGWDFNFWWLDGWDFNSTLHFLLPNIKIKVIKQNKARNGKEQLERILHGMRIRSKSLPERISCLHMWIAWLHRNRCQYMLLEPIGGPSVSHFLRQTFCLKHIILHSLYFWPAKKVRHLIIMFSRH